MRFASENGIIAIGVTLVILTGESTSPSAPSLPCVPSPLRYS